MHRVLCQVFAAGFLLAGCQSPSLFTAGKATSRPSESNRNDKGTSPWLDKSSIAETPDARRGGNRGRSDADLNKAHAALSAGRIREAKALYEQVLRDDPDNAAAHHRLGTIADRERNFRAASRHYAIALRQRHNDAPLLSDVGWSMFLQQRYPESERYLKRAIELDDRNEKALYNLGWLYGVQDQPELAYRLFLRAGPPEKARRLMARLKTAGASDRKLMLAGGTSDRGGSPDLRAPDPNGLRDKGRDKRDGSARQDVDLNQMLRRKMDLERERDLARRNRSHGGYKSDPVPNRSNERYSDARTPREDDDRRFQPDRRTPAYQDPRYASRRTSPGDLNNEMRRIDTQNAQGRSDRPFDSDSTGVRQTDYAEPRPGNSDRRRSGDPQRPRSSNPGAAWPEEDPTTDNHRPVSPRGTVRYADSRRELSTGGDRQSPSRAVDPLHREALRLGHNTGAGGVPFPIVDHGSRADRALPSPDRGRASTEIRRPVAPTPWRGDARDVRSDDRDAPHDNARRAYGPPAGRDGMSRDFDDDGPVIRPRSKDTIAEPGVGGGFSEPNRR